MNRPPKKKKVPAPRSADTKMTLKRPEAIPTPGDSQLSFPFTGEVTEQSFGASLLAFARAEVIPMGRKGAYLVNQFKPIRDALDLLEERYKTALMADQDCLPGIGLKEGAQVRELKVDTAQVRTALKEEIPSISDFLNCCTPRLTALQEEIQLAKSCSPQEARMILDRALEDQLTYRQNRPTLVRLTQAEALEQAERLAEGRPE
jgi:hypothetical protein